MNSKYEMEEMNSLILSHLINKGFQVEKDKILDPEIPWRPPIYAIDDETEIVIDTRLNNSITTFWLKTYKKVYKKNPNIKIFVAIPEDIIVPYVLGRDLERNNIGIILVSDEEITYLLKPRSSVERETTKAIRKKLDAKIDKIIYEDLEPYNKEITDAVNIFEIGCPREAIGAIGRVLETAIDTYLIEANKRHKIALSERRRKSKSFHNKIEYLAADMDKGRKKPKIINQNEKTKMLSVKWDRNIGDHPADDENVQQMIQDSRAILELGINMTRLMKKKKEKL